MFDNMGFMEWGIILLMVLIFFGPEKLPKMAQTIGKTIRDVKNALNGITDDIKGTITDPLKEKFKEATADPKPASYEHQPGTEPSSYGENQDGSYDEQTGTYHEDTSGYGANPDGYNYDSPSYDGYGGNYEDHSNDPVDESKHFLKASGAGDDEDRRRARSVRRTRYRGKTGRG